MMKFRNKEIKYNLCAYLFSLVFVSIILINFLLNDLHLGPGDISQRSFIVMDYMNRPLFSDLFSLESLDDIWPPGHKTMLSFFLYLLNPSSLRSALFFYHIISLLFFIIGVFCFSLVSRKNFGEKYFTFSFLLLLSSGFLVDFSYTGMTEVFYFGFLGLSFYAINKFLDGNNVIYILLSSLCLLIANTFRLEPIIIVFYIFLFLLYRRHFFNALLLGFISSSYFMLKMLYVFFIKNSPYNFLNHNNSVYSLANPFYVLVKIILSFLKEEILLISVIFIIVIISSILFVKYRYGKPKDIIIKIVSEASLSIGLFFTVILFVIISVLHGSLMAQARYFITAIPFLVIFISSIISNIERNIISSKIIFNYTKLISIIVICSVSLNYILFIKRKEFLNSNDKEIIKYINDRGYGSSTIYDFLTWKEQQLMLYTSNPKLDNYSCIYSKHDAYLPTIKGLTFSTDSHIRAENNTAIFHQYIYYLGTHYIVMAAKNYYEKNISKLRLEANHLKHSYIYPYLKDLNKGAFLLTSSYIPRPVLLKKIFENKNYMILENSRSNLLRNPNRPDGPYWNFDGNVNVTRSGKRAPDPYFLLYKVKFNDVSSISQVIYCQIKASDNYSVGIWLWADNNLSKKVLFEVTADNEKKIMEINLTKRPKFYILKNKFRKNHCKMKIAIVNLDLENEVYIWGGIVAKGFNINSVPVKL